MVATLKTHDNSQEVTRHLWEAQVETEAQTCCRGDHVNEGVHGLHQLRLLPLQRRVVAAGESQLQLQRLDGCHLVPDHRLETDRSHDT